MPWSEITTRATVAGCLDVDPEQLVFALTPELRILYHLERAYGIDRPIRFLRIRNPEPAYLPEAPVDDDVSDVEIQIIHDPETAVTEPLGRPVLPKLGPRCQSSTVMDALMHRVCCCGRRGLGLAARSR